MELLPIYPPDIPGDLRRHAANGITPDRNEASERRRVLAMAEFYELLATHPGPAKWVRLNHCHLLSFFAFDTSEHRQLHQQVMIDFHGPGAVATVQYLLPVEQRPWKYATTMAYTIPEAVQLVVDGLARCESRREHLIEEIPKNS